MNKELPTMESPPSIRSFITYINSSRIRSIALLTSLLLVVGLITQFQAAANMSYKFSGYPTQQPQPPMPTGAKPRECTDPYREPGLLYYPNNTLNNHEPNRWDIKWIPYTQEFFDMEDPVQAQWPATHDAVFSENSVPPKKVLDKAPGNWMARLVEYNKALKESNPIGKLFDMSWLRNRRVLLVGDSVIRMEMENFCKELNQSYDKYVHLHKANGCHLPGLNFTVMHWHLSGMYTFRNASWWWLKDMEKVDFETRYELYHKPTMDKVIGLNGHSPDLILFESALWDERVFKEMSKSHTVNRTADGLASTKRHITWEEATYFSARMKKFIRFLRDIFGVDVPLMYQTVTKKRDVDDTFNVELWDLDRITRFLSKKMGVEVFEWARLIHSHEQWFWQDFLHPGRGPATWLWSNMMLHYLFRATGGVEVDGKVERWPSSGEESHWDECHPWNY